MADFKNVFEQKPVEYTSEDPWSMPKPLTGTQKLERLGLAALRGAWGIPGMIADAPITLGNMLAGVDESKLPEGALPSNYVSSQLGLPTSQSVGTLLERIGEAHLSPQEQEALFKRQPGYWQGFGENVAENVPAMLAGKITKLPGMGLKEAAKTVAGTTAKTAIATGASKALGLLEPITKGFTPLIQNTGFGLTAGILEPKLSPHNLEKIIGPAYAEFWAQAPNDILQYPSKLTSIIEHFEDAMKEDPALKNSERVMNAYKAIKDAQSEGTMSFERAANLVQNLGEIGSEIGGKGQVYLEKTKKAIVNNMQESNPALAKKFVHAQEFYKAWNKYKDATSFARRTETIGKAGAKAAAAEIAGALIPDISTYMHLYGVKQFLNVAMNEAAPLMNLIRESNLAGSYYKNIIKNAVKENALGVYNNKVKLGQEALKHNITATSNKTKMTPNEQGVVEYTSEDTF